MPDATTAALPKWLPVGRPQIMPCGRDFDAVVVNGIDGVRAIAWLRDCSGPAVEDLNHGLMWWLVSRGKAGGWDLPGVDIYGAGRQIVIPPADTPDTAPLHWAIPPADTCLTDPECLHRALAKVTTSPGTSSGYVSAECRFEQHKQCRHAEVPRTPRGSAVRHDPCACQCHDQLRRDLARAAR